MRALFRARKQSEIGQRGFKGAFKYLFAIPFLFRFPDEMAAIANRFANESFAVRPDDACLPARFGCLHDFSSREMSCARSGKSILARSLISSNFASVLCRRFFFHMS